MLHSPLSRPLVLTGLFGAFVMLILIMAIATPAGAQDGTYAPRFTADGKLELPPDHVWREWPTIGTPLTPNALNGGSAPFPEFHLVYIDPVSWAHYKNTGTFRDGTVIAKELTSVRTTENSHPDGSSDEVSGRGFFMGEYTGFEIAIKSKARYPDAPGNWAYYTFGHEGEPYQAVAATQPVEACNACHEAAAAEDFVFTQFYPVLRAAKP